jgi:DNA-binding XRE family transcriptional regulator
MKTFNEMLEKDLKDPAFKAEWDRTRVAREVSGLIIRYRIDNSLSQRQLAKHLGLKLRHIQQLEDGDGGSINNSKENQ